MSRAIAVWLFCSLLAGGALGETPSNSAEALFRAGRLALKDGDTRVACEHFNASFKLQKTAGTALNLAICEEQLGNLLRAWQLHRDLAQTLEPDDPRRQILAERKRGLEARLTRLKLRLAATAPADTVANDAASGAELSLEHVVAVRPGAFVLRVVAPGHSPREYPLELLAGAKRTLEVQPGPAVPVVAAKNQEHPPEANSTETPMTDPHEERPSGSSRSKWGGVALGIGGASLLASGVAAILVLREKDVVDRQCSPSSSGRQCTDKGLAAGRRGRLYSGIGAATFAAGVLGAGVGAYLLLSEDASVGAEAAMGPRLTFSKRF
jgi:hypothetical protein